MWWRHDKPEQLTKALEAGYRVVLTPRRPMYADFIQFGAHKVGRQWNGYNTVETVYAFPDAINSRLKGYEKQVLGMQMSMWTERVADRKRLDYMLFPRLIALAEAAWTTADSKEVTLFMQRLPFFFRYLDTLGIYYFNPLDPNSRPEPTAPEQKESDVIGNG
jgi:hexosaminidase